MEERKNNQMLQEREIECVGHYRDQLTRARDRGVCVWTVSVFRRVWRGIQYWEERECFIFHLFQIHIQEILHT